MAGLRRSMLPAFALQAPVRIGGRDPLPPTGGSHAALSSGARETRY